MIPRLQTALERLRTSLWALPLVMMVAGGIIATLALRIRLDAGSDPAWFLYSGDAAGAPQFLSNMVSALITMATLAISITMVVLTLAAQQLGPRLIRSFISDRRTQLALGFFLATVVYLLLVLRGVYGDDGRVPNLAVTIGTGLVLFSLIVLLLFVHHLARAIIADNAIERVGIELDARVEALLPERQASQREKPASFPVDVRRDGVPVCFAHSGYVQAIDYDRVGRIAKQHDAFVVLDYRAGQHAIRGCTAGFIGPKSAATPEFASAVAGAFLLGSERTPVQDLEFSLRQLVEIAIRALSSGVSDPYTTMVAVDRLTLSVRKRMERAPAATEWRDEAGRVRVVFPSSTFEGFVDTAYHQIRQQSTGLPDVLVRLAANIRQILPLANGEQRKVLEKHLRLVLETGRRSIDQADDRRDLDCAAGIEPQSG